MLTCSSLVRSEIYLIICCIGLLPRLTWQDGHIMQDEATYICDNCGEEIVVLVDLSAGSRQTYVEDCPVCCTPNVIHVELDEQGDIRIWGEAEQDRY